ncbi:MAG TPA: hypothetical protein VE977_06825, partial [Pyrinomonadaceae bacterium]|nr:hypothetical protein [Pyrinomonadaceae bacterium]
AHCCFVRGFSGSAKSVIERLRQVEAQTWTGWRSPDKLRCWLRFKLSRPALIGNQLAQARVARVK